jgi:hypothetical protein
MRVSAPQAATPEPKPLPLLSHSPQRTPHPQSAHATRPPGPAHLHAAERPDQSPRIIHDFSHIPLRSGTAARSDAGEYAGLCPATADRGEARAAPVVTSSHASLAVQRKGLDDDPPGKTGPPSARAITLLQMFQKGVTDKGLPFTAAAQADFDTAAADPASRTETIQTKLNDADCTYTFITNAQTGFIHVRAQLTKTGASKYYQAEQAAIAAPTDASTGPGDKPAGANTGGSRAAAKPPTGTDAPKETSSSGDKEPPDTKTKPPQKPKLHKLVLQDTSGGFIGAADQTWLPGTDRGKPLQQGDLTWELEDELASLAKRITKSDSPPKQLQVSVQLFNDTGTPAIGYGYAAENMARNIRKFLEARIPGSVKVSEVHQVIQGKKPAGPGQQLITITPVY